MPTNYLLFDESQLRDLHQAALTVLAETGIEVHHEEARGLLARHGCPVEEKSGIVRIPPDLVRQALGTAPGEIVMYGAGGQPAVRLAPGEVHFLPGTSAIELIDWRTGQRREPTCADTADFLRLADALPHMHFGAAFGKAADCPDAIWDRYRLYLMLKHCTKPSIAGAFTFGAVPEMVQLMEAADSTGQRSMALHRALIFGCSSPPLKWADFVVQALIDCAAAGAPFGIITMPGIGGTAPATIAGAIVQGHAEILAGVVLSQVVRPGAEVVHGCSPMLFDARYGTMRGGAIEAMMLVVGLVELGRYVGLPTHAFLGFSDAKVHDQQAAAESAAGLMLAAWAGANCIFGPGMLYSERATDYTKLVFDNEICGQALRLARGVRVDAETLAVEEFAKARLEDTVFMATEHTLRHYRAETSLPGEIIDVLPPSQWLAAGQPTALDRARAVVQRLLRDHHPQPLDRDAADRLDRAMRALMDRHGVRSLPLGPPA